MNKRNNKLHKNYTHTLISPDSCSFESNQYPKLISALEYFHQEKKVKTSLAKFPGINTLPTNWDNYIDDMIKTLDQFFLPHTSRYDSFGGSGNFQSFLTAAANNNNAKEGTTNEVEERLVELLKPLSYRSLRQYFVEDLMSQQVEFKFLKVVERLSSFNSPISNNTIDIETKMKLIVCIFTLTMSSCFSSLAILLIISCRTILSLEDVEIKSAWIMEMIYNEKMKRKKNFLFHRKSAKKKFKVSSHELANEILSVLNDEIKKSLERFAKVFEHLRERDQQQNVLQFEDVPFVLTQDKTFFVLYLQFRKGTYTNKLEEQLEQNLQIILHKNISNLTLEKLIMECREFIYPLGKYDKNILDHVAYSLVLDDRGEPMAIELIRNKFEDIKGINYLNNFGFNFHILMNYCKRVFSNFKRILMYLEYNNIDKEHVFYINATVNLLKDYFLCFNDLFINFNLNQTYLLIEDVYHKQCLDEIKILLDYLANDQLHVDPYLWISIHDSFKLYRNHILQIKFNFLNQKDNEKNSLFISDDHYTEMIINEITKVIVIGTLKSDLTLFYPENWNKRNLPFILGLKHQQFSSATVSVTDDNSMLMNDDIPFTHIEYSSDENTSVSAVEEDDQYLSDDDQYVTETASEIDYELNFRFKLLYPELLDGLTSIENYYMKIFSNLSCFSWERLYWVSEFTKDPLKKNFILFAICVLHDELMRQTNFENKTNITENERNEIWAMIHIFIEDLLKRKLKLSHIDNDTVQLNDIKKVLLKHVIKPITQLKLTYTLTDYYQMVESIESKTFVSEQDILSSILDKNNITFAFKLNELAVLVNGILSDVSVLAGQPNINQHNSVANHNSNSGAVGVNGINNRIDHFIENLLSLIFPENIEKDCLLYQLESCGLEVFQDIIDKLIDIYFKTEQYISNHILSINIQRRIVKLTRKLQSPYYKAIVLKCFMQKLKEFQFKFLLHDKTSITMDKRITRKIIGFISSVVAGFSGNCNSLLESMMKNSFIYLTQFINYVQQLNQVQLQQPPTSIMNLSVLLNKKEGVLQETFEKGLNLLIFPSIFIKKEFLTLFVNNLNIMEQLLYSNINLTNIEISISTLYMITKMRIYKFIFDFIRYFPHDNNLFINNCNHLQQTIFYFAKKPAKSPKRIHEIDGDLSELLFDIVSSQQLSTNGIISKLIELTDQMDIIFCREISLRVFNHVKDLIMDPILRKSLFLLTNEINNRVDHNDNNNIANRMTQLVQLLTPNEMKEHLFYDLCHMVSRENISNYCQEINNNIEDNNYNESIILNNQIICKEETFWKITVLSNHYLKFQELSKEMYHHLVLPSLKLLNQLSIDLNNNTFLIEILILLFKLFIKTITIWKGEISLKDCQHLLLEIIKQIDSNQFKKISITLHKYCIDFFQLFLMNDNTNENDKHPFLQYTLKSLIENQSNIRTDKVINNLELNCIMTHLIHLTKILKKCENHVDIYNHCLNLNNFETVLQQLLNTRREGNLDSSTLLQNNSNLYLLCLFTCQSLTNQSFISNILKHLNFSLKDIIDSNVNVFIKFKNSIKYFVKVSTLLREIGLLKIYKQSIVLLKNSDLAITKVSSNNNNNNIHNNKSLHQSFHSFDANNIENYNLPQQQYNEVLQRSEKDIIINMSQFIIPQLVEKLPFIHYDISCNETKNAYHYVFKVVNTNHLDNGIANILMLNRVCREINHYLETNNYDERLMIIIGVMIGICLTCRYYLGPLKMDSIIFKLLVNDMKEDELQQGDSRILMCKSIRNGLRMVLGDDISNMLNMFNYDELLSLLGKEDEMKQAIHQLLHTNVTRDISCDDKDVAQFLDFFWSTMQQDSLLCLQFVNYMDGLNTNKDGRKPFELNIIPANYPMHINKKDRKIDFPICATKELIEQNIYSEPVLNN
ncbi:hypothetical protein ABK040_008714 [Willaertia magna]